MGHRKKDKTEKNKNQFDKKERVLFNNRKHFIGPTYDHFEDMLRHYAYLIGKVDYIGNGYIVFKQCELFKLDECALEEDVKLAFLMTPGTHIVYNACVKIHTDGISLGQDIKLFVDYNEQCEKECIAKMKNTKATDSTCENIYKQYNFQYCHKYADHALVLLCIEKYEGRMKFGLRRNYHYNEKRGDDVSCSGIVEELDDNHALIVSVKLYDCDWLDSWIEAKEDHVLIRNTKDIEKLKAMDLKKRDKVHFSGKVYQYLYENGEVNYSIKNISNVSVESWNDCDMDTVRKITCNETCMFYEHCNGVYCLRNENEMAAVNDFWSGVIKAERMEKQSKKKKKKNNIEYSQSGKIKGFVLIKKELDINVILDSLTNIKNFDEQTFPVSGIWTEECDIQLYQNCCVDNISPVLEYLEQQYAQTGKECVLNDSDVIEFEGTIKITEQNNDGIFYKTDNFDYVKKISVSNFYRRQYETYYKEAKVHLFQNGHNQLISPQDLDERIETFMYYTHPTFMYEYEEIKEKWLYQTVPVDNDFYERRRKEEIRKKQEQRLNTNSYMVSEHKLGFVFNQSLTVNKHNNVRNEKWKPLKYSDMDFIISGTINFIGDGNMNFAEDTVRLEYGKGDRAKINEIIDGYQILSMFHRNIIQELGIQVGDVISICIDCSETGNAKMYENKHNDKKKSIKIKVAAKDVKLLDKNNFTSS